MTGMQTSRRGHVREAGWTVPAMMMVMVRTEIGITGRRRTASRDGCCARVTDGAGQGGKRRILLMRVVWMLVTSLGPGGARHWEPAYWSEGTIVAVGVVVILSRALAAST